MILLTILFLFIASVCDIRAGLVPLWIGPAAVCLRILYLLSYVQNPFLILECFLVGGGLFLFYCFFAKYGTLGGMDCIAILICGLSIGIYGLYTGILAALLSIPHILIASKRENKDYPFIPYIFCGFILSLLIMRLQGIMVPLLL